MMRLNFIFWSCGWPVSKPLCGAAEVWTIRWATGQTTIFSNAMLPVLPLIHQMCSQLLTDQSEMSVTIQKHILKISFPFIRHHLLLELITQPVFTVWTELACQVAVHPLCWTSLAQVKWQNGSGGNARNGRCTFCWNVSVFSFLCHLLQFITIRCRCADRLNTVLLIQVAMNALWSFPIIFCVKTCPGFFRLSLEQEGSTFTTTNVNVRFCVPQRLRKN